MCRNLKPIFRNSVLHPALAHSMMEYCPKALHAMTCKWWKSPNGHVAKVPGNGDCKSRPLAMSSQVVVLYRHILLLHFTQTCVHVWLKKTSTARLLHFHFQNIGFELVFVIFENKVFSNHKNQNQNTTYKQISNYTMFSLVW